jgi:hypothetical protein
MKMFTFHKRPNARDEVESYGFTRSFGSRYAHELRNEVVAELNSDLVSQSGANLDSKLVRGNKNSGMENEKGRRAEKSGKEVRGIHSEKQACPRREGNEALQGLGSSYRQAERGGKVCWDAAQSDGHLPRCGNASIANQPLLKRQPIMRPLRTRQRR